MARVTTMGDGAAPIVLSNIKVPKNGYVMVYISNESDIPVYFDNLQVRHDRGRILEENHYYAYGLKIAALSSKAFGGAPNNYQYQGDYSEFDDDLGWNDFMLRSYDPQLGRFLQHDPYDQFASGYVGMGNDPGNVVDPTGGFGDPISTLDMVTVVGKAKVGTLANKLSSGFAAVKTTVTSVRLAHVYGNSDVSFRIYTPEAKAKVSFAGQEYDYSHSEVEQTTTDKKIDLLPAPADFSPPPPKENPIIVPNYGDPGENISNGLNKSFDDLLYRIYRNSDQYALDKRSPNPVIEQRRPPKTDIQRWVEIDPFIKTSASVLTFGLGSSANTNVSLGAGRIAVKEWLQNVGKLERGQLIKDIEGAGFKKVFDEKGMMHFGRGSMKIRLDPKQPGTPFNHMHLNYGGNKSAYDIFLKPVNYKSPAAHIPIK